MNGIETILARIASDAQQKIDDLRRENEQELSAIREKYTAERDQLYNHLHALGKQTAEERYERLCSAAEMETKKLTLAARQEVIAEAYELALEKLCSLDENAYIALLVSLAAKASRQSGALVFSPADRERVGAAVVAQVNAEHGRSLVLSERIAPLRGGFILDEGATEINCSFEALVRASREQTERAVARVLFP